MSKEFTAIALIGIELDEAKLFHTVRERGCSHEIPPGGEDYCAECGALIWKETEYPIESFAQKEDPEFLKIDEIIFGNFSCIASTNYDRIFLGLCSYCWSIDYSAAKVEIESSLIDIKRQLQQFLEPLELWDENKFGLWAIADIS